MGIWQLDLHFDPQLLVIMNIINDIDRGVSPCVLAAPGLAPEELVNRLEA